MTMPYIEIVENVNQSIENVNQSAGLLNANVSTSVHVLHTGTFPTLRTKYCLWQWHQSAFWYSHSAAIVSHGQTPFHTDRFPLCGMGSGHVRTTVADG